jgi:hypothetical protein
MELWRCTSENCGCEIAILKPSRYPDDFRPTCGCGHPMKKPYTSPRFERIVEPDTLRILHNEVFLGRP